MKINPDAFKAYDIRGKVPEEVNAELAYAVGRALADFLPKGSIAVGQDMRPGSGDFSKRIIEGALKQGRKVYNLGQCSTDMIYFGIAHLGCVGGAMVTASHNPNGYNGIKLTAFNGKSLDPIGIESGLIDIQSAIENDRYSTEHSIGKLEKTDVLKAWMDHALGFSPKLKPLRVGMDFGNGMAGIFLTPLNKQTPLQITGLYSTPDGTFPNHPADPLQEKNLQDLKSLVKQNKLDVGIAFDGDGDRAILVDENSQMVDPSIVGAIIASKFLKEELGSSIVYGSTASRLLPETIKELGGVGIASRTGHSFIKTEMNKYRAIFGAESSGHYYYAKNFNADSGLITALLILQILSDSNKSLSELCAPLRTRYVRSGERNFVVRGKKVIIEKIAAKFSDGKQDNLDGLTVSYDAWWFNVRSSNTEPLLRLNVEAKNQIILNKKILLIEDLINHS